MAVPATGIAGLYPPPDGVAPPTAWTIGVRAFPRSSFRFQTKKLRLFFCQDTNGVVSFSAFREVPWLGAAVRGLPIRCALSVNPVAVFKHSDSGLHFDDEPADGRCHRWK